LDYYDEKDLASDDGDYGITLDQKRAADEIISARMRERLKRKDQRFAEAADDDSLDDERPGDILLRPQDDDDVSDDGDGRKEYKDQEVNLEAFDVPLAEWISQDRTRREIQNRFRRFLTIYRKRNDYKDEVVYLRKIRCPYLTISFVFLNLYVFS